MSPLRHLIGMKELTNQQIEVLLDRAQYWAEREGESSAVLSGRFVANLFFEPSTRTRFSFEVAEKRLGAHVLNFSAATSSTTKGETIYDTLSMMEAMGAETAVIRTTQNGLFQELLEKNVGVKLVNGGDGTNEHPTQCLLDLLTMKQDFGKIEGLKVAIIGDLRHSRVLGSHLHALPKLGAELILTAPPNMMRATEDIPATAKIMQIDEAIQTADVVMLLRVQLERHNEQLFESTQSYHEAYGLTLKRELMMKPEAIIMHPGPFNRGVEIDSNLVSHKRSRIVKQVSNGVAVRMAVLESLMNGGENKWESSLQTANC